MLRAFDYENLSDKEALGAKNVQHEVTSRPRAHTRNASARFVDVKHRRINKENDTPKAVGRKIHDSSAI